MRAHITRPIVFVAFALALVVSPSRAAAQWLEAKADHYSVFYQAGFARDVTFTRTWLDRAERVMKEKYGVEPSRYYMSVYLFPAPIQLPPPLGALDAVQSGQNQCCTRSGGVSTGTIRLLSLSAALWKEQELKSSLGLSK